MNNRLWSASVLVNEPGAIRDVHLSYLESGADCITAATYQASFPGFIEAGFSKAQARNLILKAIDIAYEAREEYLDRNATEGTDRRPLIAASIGPYGAYLADGSEYRGGYSVTRGDLRTFHESRWEILSKSRSDIFAIETIPSIEEADVLLDLLKETPETFAWFSFCCVDGEHISDGTHIRECAALLDDCDQVVAAGMNCTAPRYISSLVKELRATLRHTEIIVYPNSGETYDATTKTWTGIVNPHDCGLAAREWHRMGARLLGGCCRTGPEHIRAIRKAVTGNIAGCGTI